MLGKVIVHGATREAARRALVTALDDTGDPRPHHATSASCASSPPPTRSATTQVDTGWLDRNPDAIRPHGVDVPAGASAAWSLAARHDADPRQPFGVGDGWRLARSRRAVPVELVVRGRAPAVHGRTRAGSVTCGRHDAGGAPHRQ